MLGRGPRVADFMWRCGGGHMWAAYLGSTQGGFTALIYTATFGHADCARLLLDAGADKNANAIVRARAGCWHVGFDTCDTGDECLLCAATCRFHSCFIFKKYIIVDFVFFESADSNCHNGEIRIAFRFFGFTFVRSCLLKW